MLLASVAQAAPRWRVPAGSDALVRVDAARGRVAVADGKQLTLYDRDGKKLAAQSLPAALPGKIEVVELGPAGAIVAGGHGALLVREAGAPILVPLPDGEAAGAAPLADGGYRLCLRGVGVAAIDGDGKRRWTAPAPVVRCAPEGLQRDGTLWAAGERSVIAVGPDGRVRTLALPAIVERAPVVWPFGVLAQADDGLYALSPRGEVVFHAAADDGVLVEGTRAVVVSARRLAWVDYAGRVVQRSAPIETPVESLRRSAPVDEQPLVGAPGLVASAAAGALVLVGADGRERFRLGLPGVRAALPLSAGEWVIARPDAVELQALPDGVLEDPTAAAREIARDRGVDEWARVAAWTRANQGLDGARGDLSRLGARLAAAYKREHAAVLTALDELGPAAAAPALAVLRAGALPADGPILARLIARGGEAMHAPVEGLLAGHDPPVAAAQALALLARAAPSLRGYRAALHAALFGERPRLTCTDRPDEIEALSALVDALGRPGGALAGEVGRALAADPQPACRARALAQLELRVAPPETTVQRLRASFAQKGRLDPDELAVAEALGAPAAAALVEMLGRAVADPARAIVETLVRMTGVAPAREAVLALVTGKIVGPRAPAIRAAAGLPMHEAGAALAAALRSESDPALLHELADAAAHRSADEVGAALGDALVRALASNAPVSGELLAALGQVAPEEAARRAIALAGDGTLPLPLRLDAVRIAARAPSAGMRPALDKLAEAGGPLGEAAARASLPWIGLRLDEKLRVTGVEPRSPAERAGVRRGDGVVTVNERRFPSLSALEDYQSTLRIGDGLAIAVERGGAALTVRLTVGSALAVDGN